jgi:osmotically-inducible protein OsmY
MRKSLLLAFVLLSLAVVAACSSVAPRRDFHRVMADRNVQITAQRALDHDQQLAGQIHIGTDVYNGVLLMIGEATTEAAKERAEQDVTGYDGVRRVINLVDVMPLATGGRTALDATLTARVKTGLLGLSGLPGFDPGDVKVSTAHGKVYLMGLLTKQEADAVIANVSHAAGVKEVVPVFEYIQ